MHAQAAPLQHTSTSNQGIYLSPRMLSWNFSDMPACPAENNPDLAAYIMAVSVFVVAFEDWGIPVVREHLPQLQDHPPLAREGQAFIAQEALHSQGHIQANAAILSAHDFDLSAVERVVARFKRQAMAGTAQEQLALVAAMEHAIFSVADWYIKSTHVQQQVQPELNRLMLWHAMEEMEHTAVGFDIYQHIYGSQGAAYRTRVKALGYGSKLAVKTLYRLWRNLRPQMARHNRARTQGYWPAQLTRKAIRYVPEFLRFIAPGYSPWSSDFDQQILPALSRQLAPTKTVVSSHWQDVKIHSIVSVSADVSRYRLTAIDGSELPPFKAGAHLDVEIEPGIVRQYSLCSNPAEHSHYEIAVKREALGRGGSLRLHQQFNEGASIRVGQPRNHFSLQEQSGEYLLLAAGIGITPLLAMAHELHNAGKAFRLHLCASDRAHLPFAEQLAALPFAERIQLHLSSERQNADRLDRLVPAWDAQQPRQIYSCGPNDFMHAVAERAGSLGWPKTALFSERFGSNQSQTQHNHPFTLHLAKAGKSLAVGADQSISSVLASQGIAVPTSCCQGLCGACISPVVDGEIDHRDSILNEEELHSGKTMAICVSRAKGQHLTLDI